MQTNYVRARARAQLRERNALRAKINVDNLDSDSATITRTAFVVPYNYIDYGQAYYNFFSLK